MNERESVLDSAEDLYEHAPCGYLSTQPDGLITKVNTTMLTWLGVERAELLGKYFSQLLTGGGRIHYESRFAPMLYTQGGYDSAAVDLVTSDGERIPVFITANVKADEDGSPLLVRITAIDARERRAYEQELLEERRRADNERVRAQLLAATLQRSLLPSSLVPPAGLEVAAYYHYASADEVGGDFYDLFPLSDDKWGFFLGDVCGKGPDAAAITSSTRYGLRAAAVYDSDPIVVLKALNIVLQQEFNHTDARFCTVVFGVLTRKDGGFDIELASGGHPPALLLGGDGSARYIETKGGQLVGILPDARFVSARLSIGPGDTLVLYTDGLTEARIGTGRVRYDDAGALIEFAKENAPSSAQSVVDKLTSVMGSFGEGLEDDAAIMAFGIPPEK